MGCETCFPVAGLCQELDVQLLCDGTSVRLIEATDGVRVACELCNLLAVLLGLLSDGLA